MNEQMKRRSLLIIEALEEKSNEVEAIANETVQMVIRGDDQHRIPPQVRSDVETIKDSVEKIKNCVANLNWYINRKQETHRL